MLFRSYEFVKRSYLSYMNKELLSIYDQYMISHYCHGCVSILGEWLTTSNTLTPEDIANIFYDSMPNYLRPAWITDW